LQPFLTKLPKGIRARIIELPRTDSDEDLRQYYGLMDVFVHASKIGESFGMVLCEAMLSGIPVITIATPLRNNSQIEVVSHGKAGLVVQNQKQMINAMIMIQKDFKGLELMKRSAREWIIEKYDVPVVSHMLVKLAIVTLASDSSQNLAMRLAANPEICSSAPPNLFCDIYKSAGLRLSLFDRILTSLINRPMSRRVISIVHAIKSRMR
jgi:hypothetical protein